MIKKEAVRNKSDFLENKLLRVLHEAIRRSGVNFATGVPCGVLGAFIRVLGSDPQILHVPALNEREAVGLAAGAYLGGKMPMLYMQNSGLFVSSNDYASILALMKIPALAIISHRGCEGENATQHLLTGRHTKSLLDGLGIFYREMTDDNIEQVFQVISRYVSEALMPAAILVKRGWAKSLVANTECAAGIVSGRQRSIGEVRELITGSVDIDRDAAIDCIVSTAMNFREARLPAVISTTGLISRSLFERYDNANLMYNPGGFGQVLSIGCGFALAKPNVRTIVVDGDASFLADVGNAILVGVHQPKMLTHIVIDNEAYSSCSEEKSLSSVVNISALVVASGYRNVFRVDTAERLESVLLRCRNLNGPNMIIAKVKLGGRRDFARPLDMGTISKRFREYFA